MIFITFFIYGWQWHQRELFLQEIIYFTVS